MTSDIIAPAPSNEKYWESTKHGAISTLKEFLDDVQKEFEMRISHTHTGQLSTSPASQFALITFEIFKQGPTTKGLRVLISRASLRTEKLTNPAAGSEVAAFILSVTKGIQEYRDSALVLDELGLDFS